MRLDTERRNVETSGLQETGQFNIEMNAASIDILSRKIYSNPTLAIVRELACNAWDAHVAAGKTDQPFNVYFPNELKSEFKIRDFGIGLSHDDVMVLYTTYFGSNKRDSNSMIGGLGLGSKTPYAYTNAFSVRSFLDGELREYAAYKNEDGIPTISLVNTSETTEENGLEIAVPVKQGDARKFLDVAQRALQWFPTQPNTFGYVMKPVTWESKRDLCGVLKDNERYGSAQVVMGNVAYKLDLNTISKSHDLSRAVSAMARGSRFVLFAEIGELAIAASREELNYTDKTTKRLYDMLNAANKDLVAHIAQGIDNEKTISGKFYWRAKLPEEVRDMITVDTKIDVPQQLQCRMVQRHTWRHETGIKTTVCHQITLEGSEHPAILVLENKTAAFKKIIEKEQAMHPRNKSVYRYSSYSASRDVFIIWKPDDKASTTEQTDFIEFMKNFESEYVFWSSAYKMERQRPTKQAGTYVKPATRKRKVYTTKHLRNYSSKHNWNETEAALDSLDLKNHILVGYHANHVANHDKDQESYGQAAIEVANFLREGDEVFLGVPRMAWKTAKKQGFLTLNDWIDMKLKTWIKQHNVVDYVFAMRHEQLAKEFPLLERYVNHHAQWAKHAPDSIAHVIAEEFKHIGTDVGRWTRERFTWVERYQGKSVFKTEMDEIEAQVRHKMAGAEEWLRFCYPELTETMLKSRWNRIDAVAGYYINCKEGLDCDER